MRPTPRCQLAGNIEFFLCGKYHSGACSSSGAGAVKAHDLAAVKALLHAVCWFNGLIRLAPRIYVSFPVPAHLLPGLVAALFSANHS
jgi:hypothetical protein